MRNQTIRSLAFAALLVCITSAAQQPPERDRWGFELALPGYAYEFPRDHGSHESFRTEWWYYTGHVTSDSGRLYGFEVTFFRVGVMPPEARAAKTRWELDDVSLAHFAITDVAGRKFRYYEKLNRTSPFTAAARAGSLSVFNEGWSIVTNADGSFRLRASANGDAIDLRLASAKAPAIHGENGVSVKAAGKGFASHYYSLTRVAASGTIAAGGSRAEKCSGLAWMDHEFGSSYLREDQQGWDWFSVQLDNETELMLYRIRRADGSQEPASSGSLVMSDGTVIHLRAQDFSLVPRAKWRSPKSGAVYPHGWTIRVVPFDITLQLKERLDDQELVTQKSTRVTYWEGLVDATGTYGGTAVRGRGYVEMTGYARADAN